MTRFAPFLVMLMFPVLVLAEPVAVVSGEHDGYTRLVFYISPDRDWNLVTGKSSATLVFPKQNIEFEDDGVFARIAETRLVLTHSEQNEGAAEYRMTLGCDCEVGAFPYLDAYIVVDIADATAPSVTALSERHLTPILSPVSLPDGDDGPPEFVSWIPPLAPHYVSSPQRVSFPAQTDGVGLTPTQFPDLPPETSHSDVTHVVPDGGIPFDQELQEAVDAARNSLLQELTLAADQGLLDLNGPILETQQDVETVYAVEPDAPPAPFVESKGENQILIQTAIARDALAARGGANSQNDHCPPSEELDITLWGSGEDFLDELSSSRRKLLREFDEPDFTEVGRLVRTYLRYGFGVEARSYLLEGGQNIAQNSLLLDFAAIVDGQTVQAGGPISQAVECDGVAGLWALVGTYPAVNTEIENKSSIVEAFAALPPDIRRLVGPKLASAFLDRGFVVTARRIADILERAPGSHGAEHELVVGNLMVAEGNSPEAGQAYLALSEDNSKVAIDALIELATLGLTQKQPPPRNLLLDLGAKAKIWRGTQKGGELRRLEALWLAKQGREISAIELLVAEILHDPMNADILQETAEEILLVSSVIENQKSNYAEAVHTYIGFIPTDEKADVLRLGIAAKLLLSGLPDYAIEVLHPALQRNEVEAALMAASANIQAFRPETALLLLNEIADDTAKLLRVEAYLGIGDFEQALGQLEQFAIMSGAIVKPYWYKGDWVAIIKTNNAAAEIRERFFPDNKGAAPRLDDLLTNGTFTLSAMQKLLADSQSRSAELEIVLLQQ